MRGRAATAVLAAVVACLGAGPAAASAPGYWHPRAAPIEWQWELDHPLRLGNAADMGLGATTASGKPAANPTVYDIDGFDNSAATVAALHARGDRVICYVEVGAAESYRPDYHEFPASSLGRRVPGYPEERYLDIRDPAVVRVIRARIAMCHAKGFDAVEPDIDDSYADPTGFAITESEDLAYDIGLAGYAHRLGMAWGQKNGDGDPRFSRSLEPHAQFLLDEQCFQYATCSTVAGPYRRAGKPVLEVEYALARSRFCPAADRNGFDSMRMDVALAGGRAPCR